MDEQPKLFISYSWSSPEHIDWVLQLATDLRESGVNAVLDKWDLREGQEAVAFMESMVTDAKISKVLIVSDRTYAEKADARIGGAGSEAQIISAGLFRRAENSKFVAVVRDLNQDGEPYVPAYYTSRIYIDFTDETRRQESFEQLLRWIFEKPLHRKPPVGRAPQYILDEASSIKISTSLQARRARDAIVNGRNFAAAAAEDYFLHFSQEIINFSLKSEKNIDANTVRRFLDDALPYRNEVVEVIDALSRYSDSSSTPELLHDFIQRLHDVAAPRTGAGSFRDIDGDVILFVTWEISLYALAIAIKSNKPSIFRHLMDTPFVPASDSALSHGSAFFLGEEFRHNDAARIALSDDQKNFYAPSATFLKGRPSASGIGFDLLNQADFIAFLRDHFARRMVWMPTTLVYNCGRWSRPFPEFIKSRSRAYFARAQEFLGVNSDDLVTYVSEVERETVRVPKWGFDSVNPRMLMDIDNLCTLP